MESEAVNRIVFSCESGMEGVFPNPVPASKLMPRYFMPIKAQSSEVASSSTVKRCVPFVEAMTAGYIIPLWADIQVVAKGGELSVNFPPNFPQAKSLESHSYEQIPGHPLADSPYGRFLMKFINPWVVETSPGWSCLFTSPMNHLERRLKIIDGIVDTDRYYNNINFPFIWTGGDGSFFLQRGTPLVQVVPFQRGESTMSVDNIDMQRRKSITDKLGTSLRNAYRNDFWSGARTAQTSEVDGNDFGVGAA